jgi:hypothetical protein
MVGFFMIPWWARHIIFFGLGCGVGFVCNFIFTLYLNVKARMRGEYEENMV